MEKRKKLRVLALFLSVSLLISVLLPGAFADNSDTDASNTEPSAVEEPVASTEPSSIAESEAASTLEPASEPEPEASPIPGPEATPALESTQEPELTPVPEPTPVSVQEEKPSATCTSVMIRCVLAKSEFPEGEGLAYLGEHSEYYAGMYQDTADIVDGLVSFEAGNVVDTVAFSQDGQVLEDVAYDADQGGFLISREALGSESITIDVLYRQQPIPVMFRAANIADGQSTTVTSDMPVSHDPPYPFATWHDNTARTDDYGSTYNANLYCLSGGADWGVQYASANYAFGWNSNIGRVIQYPQNATLNAAGGAKVLTYILSKGKYRGSDAAWTPHYNGSTFSVLGSVAGGWFQARDGYYGTMNGRTFSGDALWLVTQCAMWNFMSAAYSGSYQMKTDLANGRNYSYFGIGSSGDEFMTIIQCGAFALISEAIQWAQAGGTFDDEMQYIYDSIYFVSASPTGSYSYLGQAASGVTVQDMIAFRPYSPPKYWSAVLMKVDAETGTAQGDASLDGAQYTLYKSGRAVKSYTVQNGRFATEEYPCTADNGIYTLKETKAPLGYQLDTTVYRLSTRSPGVIEVSSPERVIKGTITIDKRAVNTVSGKSQPEQGAEFQVWLKSSGGYSKAKSTERDIITIGADGTGTSKKLPYGTYCVSQTKSWDGYGIDGNVYEQTVPSSLRAGALTLKNNIWTGAVTINKVDGDTNMPLAGAEFTLTGSDGSKKVRITGVTGKVIFDDLVYGVTYTWSETKAPKGYLLNSDSKGTWSVSKPDDSFEVTCENFRRPGSIVATKQDTAGKPLSGCVFLLEYLDRGAWKPVTTRSTDTAICKGGCTSTGLSSGTLTTDKTGAVTFEGLWADDAIQYRLSEITAPDGYELLSKVVYQGTLPVGYKEGEVSETPDEVISGKAYFYTLPVTVTNGRIYTLPMTGGSRFPMIPAGILLTVIGAAAITIVMKRRKERL